MVGFFNAGACYWKTGQRIMFILLTMVASFYIGTLFGNSSTSPYVPFEQPAVQQDETSVSISNDSVNSEFVGLGDLFLATTFLHQRVTTKVRSFRKEELERGIAPPLSRRLFFLVPPPANYKIPISWPTSRDYVWRNNVNHTHLAEVKGGQKWVHEKGQLWWFPGGGTHFKNGASEYI